MVIVALALYPIAKAVPKRHICIIQELRGYRLWHKLPRWDTVQARAHQVHFAKNDNCLSHNQCICKWPKTATVHSNIYIYICVCLHFIYMLHLYINKEQNIESVRARTIKNVCIFPWLPNIYLVDSKWILSENNNSAYISEKGSFNYYSKYRAHVFNWKTCYVDYKNTFFRSVIFLVVIATNKILKTTFH